MIDARSAGHQCAVYLLDKRASQGIQDRLKGLLEDVERARGHVIIPAQVIAEYLVNAGPAGPALLAALLQSRYVVVAAFDHVAAVECAAMQRAASATGDKRAPLPRGTAWQKVKVDRQIVAIAKVRASRIVADDGDIQTLATAEKVPVQSVASLPLPAWAQQLHIEGVQRVAQPPARRMRLGPVSTTDKPAEGTS